MTKPGLPRKTPRPISSHIPNQIPNQIPDQIDTLLADLWKKNLPTLEVRLALLDRVASNAAAGTLAEATRLEALSVAHKLSGSLGMFGYQQGTQIAGSIEHILKTPTPEDLATLPTLAASLRASLVCL
jgi:HPt (histidine-containing phosphotransfer) domain-containing protein